MTIEDFLQRLREISQPGEWHVSPDGQIRAGYQLNGPEMCPITRVYADETGKVLQLWEVEAVACRWELDLDDLREIVNAADGNEYCNPLLREKLRYACYLPTINNTNQE